MDCQQTGNLILKCRKERGFTQLELANAIGVSDKAVSKWERGLGCPDVSLLRQLSEVLKINTDSILSGSIKENDTDGGNMKRIKFYVCSECGNIISAVSDAEISCCGRKLTPLTPQKAETPHIAKIEHIENDWFVTIPHEMTKSHYITFAALITTDRVTIVKLYPEQEAQFRLPFVLGARLCFCCNKHGLWVNDK